jgi:hypothetical protein
MDRLWLREEIREENRRLERQVRQNPLDMARLQGEYGLANHIVHLNAPIHKLPFELLSEIFLIVLDEREHSIDPLMRVCHQWKVVVSSIWGSLRLGTWTKEEKVTNVNKGGRWLLDVTIDPATDETTQPFAAGAEPYTALALASSTTTQRWRELNILSLPSEDGGEGFSLRWVQQLAGGVLKGELRSLNIEVQHESSPFLDQLLSSISAISQSRLTDIQLRSPQVLSYLTQQAGWSISNQVTSLKVVLPRTDMAFDVLPHFHRLEIFEATRVRLVGSTAEMKLPLTATLRQLVLKSVAIDWMHGREFSRLQQCYIISPPEPDVLPVAALPECTVLHFEGACFDPIKQFRTSSSCALVLRSNQSSELRGDAQLCSLWGVVQSEIVLRPVTLHLRLACGIRQLLLALSRLPQLRTLVLELERPTAPCRSFFMAFLPPSPSASASTRGKGSHGRGGKGEEALHVCPSLEVLGFKYRRWFRSSELNNMLRLVAIAGVKREPRRRIKVWVEKGVPCEERLEVVDGLVSERTLCSLGCLRLPDGARVSSQVVKDVTTASLATLNPSYPMFFHSDALTYFSPAVYRSLFRRLKNFTLTVQIDQGVLHEVLHHFKHLEQLSVPKLVLESTKAAGLSLFRTLRRLYLGETSLHWMAGRTFTRLQHFQIDKIEDADLSTLRSIRMPVCTSASISPSSVRVLDAFEFSRLDHLHLSMRHRVPDASSRRWGEGLYASMRQFKLRSACFEGFDNPLAFRSALAMQSELEALEIKYHGPISESELSGLFSVLAEPNTMDTTNASDTTATGATARQHRNRDAKRRSPPCLKLKTLVVRLDDTAPSKTPGMVRVGRRFVMQRKKKHRPLERCQVWWGRDEWDEWT